MRKGISRSPKVMLYAFGSETDVWWKKSEAAFKALPHIDVYKFEHNQIEKLVELVSKKMQLTISIQDRELYINAADKELSIKLVKATLIMH